MSDMNNALDELSEQLREIANAVEEESTNVESAHYLETAKLDKKIMQLADKVDSLERDKEHVLALYQEIHGRKMRCEFELALKVRSE